MNKSFVFLALLLFLSGCSKASGQEALQGFKKNKEVFSNIVVRLGKHPNIQYVEQDKRLELVKNSTNFDSEDTATYQFVENEIKLINIDKVAVLREENELEAVSFQAPLKTFDWSKMFRVVFVADGVDVQGFMPSSAQCSLIETSWFFCEYKTN